MTTSLAESVTTACAHCGLSVPAGECDPDATRQFCCPGCRTAWQLIHEFGLESFYQTDERRQAAVQSSGRDFAEFDHPAFERLYLTRTRDGLAEVELYLDGVHCASCVWLVERVPLAVPGAVAAELNVPRSLARIRWDPERTRLSAIARFLDRLGYQAHPFRGGRAEALRRAETRAMLVRIGVAGALAINVMTVAIALYAGWFGAMEASYVRYFRWVSLALTIPAVLGPGRVFFKSAWGAVAARRLHMDVPVALALGAGLLRGGYNTVTDSGPIYFDGVVTLIFLLLVGRFLQQRAQRAAADSAELLHSLTPATARLAADGGETLVPVEALEPGAEVVVRAGETVPVDGAVTDGRSALDLALLTGESRPVSVGPGDRVYAGTINQSAALRIRISEAGESTRLGRILAELEAGMRRRAPVVQTADRVAGWFVAAVLVLAAATWLVWRGTNPDLAVDNAIALLVVTCPCALALATPLAMTVAVGRAARQGILIRGADALEQLARPARLFLDKTGTLTEGRLELLHWEGAARLRPIIKGGERHSHHPIARSFDRAWPEVAAAPVDAARQTLGGGLEWEHGNTGYRIGSPAFVMATAADPDGLAERIPAHLTPVLAAEAGRVVAAAGFGDPIRPDSAAAVAALSARGFTVGVLSGDAPAAVLATATAAGIETGAVQGGMTPEGKMAAVRAALAAGPVVMVGDGVNDAPAMGTASVGVGVKGGAEACLATADVFLARPGLGPLVDLVDGARAAMRVIRTNIAISIGYNVVGAGLAIGGLINPLVAAVLMPASSLTVILLSWRSRTFRTAR
ncbi:MAG: heavy metal translocating P-type ATPase [Gemmatimonadales bacterium]